MSGATLDCTKLDYAFRTRDNGQTGSVTCWSGKKLNEGDYLLLRSGERSTRYLVTEVDRCLNVDPPTMWIAKVTFAPRFYSDEARTIEVEPDA